VELGTITGSGTLLHFGDAGRRITNIQGMSAGSFLEGKQLRPRADLWISALLAACDQAPSKSLPWYQRRSRLCAVIGWSSGLQAGLQSIHDLF
jgi:hypothetical protein